MLTYKIFLPYNEINAHFAHGLNFEYIWATLCQLSYTFKFQIYFAAVE